MALRDRAAALERVAQWRDFFSSASSFFVANLSRSKSLHVSLPNLSTSGGSVSAYKVFNAPQTARTHFSRSSRSSCCRRQTAARTPWPVISFGVFGSSRGAFLIRNWMSSSSSGNSSPDASSGRSSSLRGSW